MAYLAVELRTTRSGMAQSTLAGSSIINDSLRKGLLVLPTEWSYEGTSDEYGLWQVDIKLAQLPPVAISQGLAKEC